MTLKDVKAQVAELMKVATLNRLLVEGKSSCMMTLICEGNRADIMTVGDAGDLLTAAAHALGKFMADNAIGMETVEAFCKLTKSTAEKHMKTAERVN